MSAQRAGPLTIPLRVLFNVVVVLALLPPAQAPAADAVLQPFTAPAPPPFALRDLAGRTVDLAALRGKPVLVNFWATWCAPCVEEMPSLQRLRAALAGEVEIVAVNLQEGEPRIRAFLQRTSIDLTIVRDTDGAVARAWGARLFPTSIVIDAAGTPRWIAQGALDWMAPSVLARLRELRPAGAGSAGTGPGPPAAGVPAGR
jgi:thiol-disulfide isomerase/thioredoxin